MRAHKKFDQKAFMEEQQEIFSAEVSSVLRKAAKIRNEGKKVFSFKTKDDIKKSIKKIGENLSPQFLALLSDSSLSSKNLKQLKEHFYFVWNTVHGLGSI